MKANNLVLIVGILGVLFSGYSLITGKNTSTSLIGFISGASLVFMWNDLRKSRRKSIKS